MAKNLKEVKPAAYSELVELDIEEMEVTLEKIKTHQKIFGKSIKIQKLFCIFFVFFFAFTVAQVFALQLYGHS